ncbi:hypothetical protein KR084_012664 [Drosophila pseudotakahashii]|nr:hypothetical protein KR084_012664 [Drosophila pseudotakahashii]
MASPIRLLQLIIFLYFFKQIVSKVEFTNIKCTTFDPEFASFDYCFLKSVNRTYKYLSLKVKLLKTPVTKVKVNVAVLRKYNGYKPSLYNVTVDACKFLKNPKSNPVGAYIHNLFKSYSNMNDTCPFDHDLIVEKVSIDFINAQATNVLPVPHGDYMFHSNWFAYDIKRATVNVFGTLS